MSRNATGVFFCSSVAMLRPARDPKKHAYRSIDTRGAFYFAATS
jgi:hypothetical protein